MMTYAPGQAPAALRAPLVIGALALLLAACRGSTTQTPDLPRGIAPGTEAPMTSREASREAADREVDVGPPTPNVRKEEGITVPANSSAAAKNWRPRDEGDESDEGEGDEGEGDEGDEGEPVVDSEPAAPDDDEVGGGGPADRS